MEKYVRMILFGVLLCPHLVPQQHHSIKVGANPGSRNVVIRILIGQRPQSHIYHDNHLIESDNPNVQQIPPETLKQMGFENIKFLNDAEGRQIRGRFNLHH